MLPKEQKIHLDKDFDQIFKTDRSLYGRFLGVKVLKNKLDYSRFAIVLGTKVEKSSVKRHFLKRQIFNLIKRSQSYLFFSADCVIIALATISKANKKELELELQKLLKYVTREI